jgi:hypothetical protein
MLAGLRCPGLRCSKISFRAIGRFTFRAQGSPADAAIRFLHSTVPMRGEPPPRCIGHTLRIDSTSHAAEKISVDHGLYMRRVPKKPKAPREAPVHRSDSNGSSRRDPPREPLTLCGHCGAIPCTCITIAPAKPMPPPPPELPPELAAILKVIGTLLFRR